MSPVLQFDKNFDFVVMKNIKKEGNAAKRCSSLPFGKFGIKAIHDLRT